jgi:cullin-4
MVERLLDLKARMDEVVGTALGRSEPFLGTLKESFEYFINQRANKPAELIAKFVDARLRAGGRGAGAVAAPVGGGAAGGIGAAARGGSEEELEAALDRALTLFRCADASLWW